MKIADPVLKKSNYQIYLKRRIQTLKMEGLRTAFTAKQISTKITNNTFIIVLDENKRKQESEAF